MLGNFSCFCCRLPTYSFFKIIFSKKYLQDCQSVKLFGTRSGPTLLSVLIWVQTVCMRYPLLSSLARKELNRYCKLAESVHNHIDLYISEINKLTWFIFNNRLSYSSWHVGCSSCKFEGVIVLYYRMQDQLVLSSVCHSVTKSQSYSID